MPRLILITGKPGSGKTTRIQKIIEGLPAGTPMAGCLCPVWFDGEGAPVGKTVRRLDTGAERPLMATKPWPGATLQIGKYHVHPETLVWAEEAFATQAPVLVVDEVGPFEMQEGRGWQAALKALDYRQWKLALVSIRPSLLEIAIERWQPDEVVDLSIPGHARVKK